MNTYQGTESHTAEHLKSIAIKWKINEKIIAVITDNAANVLAAVRLTGWRSIPCFAHTLNLIVQDEKIADLRQRCRHIVTLFKQSVRATGKLSELQRDSNKSERKLVQEVETRWNSSYYMMQRIVEEYREVKLALCSLDREDLLISTSDVKFLEEAINLLKPFEEATCEISSDQYTLLSKVVPLARSLQLLSLKHHSL